MTQPADLKTGTAERTAGANGPPSLSDRVRGLRLQDGLEGGSGRGSSSAWLPWLLCLLMAITWASFAVRAYTTGGLKAILGVSSQQGGSTATSSDAAKKDKPSALAVTAGPDGMVHEVKGYLMAAHQIQVGPDRVSGKVTKIFIEEGKFFKAGEPLAELDNLDYEADYRQMSAARRALQAQLKEMKAGARPEEKAKAKAMLDEAKALLNQYQRELNRYDDLKNKQLQISEKEYDLARANVDVQKQRVAQMENDWILVEKGPRDERIEAMEAQVDQALAREKQAKEMLDRTVIRAPVDGIILSKRTEIGNLVNPLAMSTNFNGGICEMADLTDLEVDLEIQERDIRKVFVGQDCIVRADAYPERRYSARVNRIMPVANRSLAIIPIRVSVRVPRKEEAKFLKPQMGAIVNFYNREAKPEAKEPADPVIAE